MTVESNPASPKEQTDPHPETAGGVEVESVSEQLLRYSMDPSHLGDIQDAHGRARLTGVCKDSITMSVTIENDRIQKIRFAPEGCLFTRACGAAAAFLAEGLSCDQALELEAEDVARELGGLPSDHLHCARLALNTLGDALAEAMAPKK